MANPAPRVEEMVVGLYDVGEIGFIDQPDASVEVADVDYPEEVFKKLRSGRRSPHYVNGRNLTSFTKSSPQPIQYQADVRDLVVSTIGYELDQFGYDGYDHLLGIPEAMTCMTGIIAQSRGESALWMRSLGSDDKKYGVHELIQGGAAGEKVLALDNVITDSASKIEVLGPLEAKGLITAGFVVIVDREEGGREALEKAGYQLSSVVGMGAVSDILFANGRITAQQKEWADEYRCRTLASLEA